MQTLRETGRNVSSNKRRYSNVMNLLFVDHKSDNDRVAKRHIKDHRCDPQTEFPTKMILP